MANLKEIKAQAKSMNKKVKIDLTDIKKGAKVEYVPSKYMSLFTEFGDEIARKGLEKLKNNKKLKNGGKNVDLSNIVVDFLDIETLSMLQSVQLNQAEQIIEKFEKLPSVSEIKEWFFDLYGEDAGAVQYEQFMINEILREFNEAFSAAIPPSK